MPPFKTAIIGGGPAGLTLARLLQLSHIPFTVFESDASLHHRDQGGCVDLHPKMGQLALREAGLIEEFKKRSRPEGEALKLVKRNGTVALHHADKGLRPAEFSDRPEIDRVQLREMLLGRLEEGSVKWDKKLLSVKPSGKAKKQYDLHFADGVEEGVDIVIGADGAWSKVRKLLTDQVPSYAGVSFVELWALDVDKKKPWLSEYVGKGTMAMFDQDRLITAQRNDTSIRTYVGLRKPESWLKDCGIDWTQPESARRAVVEGYYNDCGEDLKRVVLESDDQLVPRVLHHLPVDLRWEPRSGITLVGDAAHLMTPFYGVGVNLAMLDSLLLAKAIIEAEGDTEKLAQGMREYETEMFKRAEEFGKKTLKGLENHFSKTGIEEMVTMVEGKMKGAGGGEE